MPLTEKQAQDYVFKGASKCPFCGCEEIIGGSYNDEGPCREVECSRCEETWTEVFSLVGIGHRSGNDYTEFIVKE